MLIHYFRNTQLDYLVVSRMGALFLVDQENKVDRSLLVKGEWEQEQVRRLWQLVDQHRPVGSDSMFLDIGAHGGLYSIIMCKNYVFKQVIAFEPDKTNMAQLHANLFINGLIEKIRVVPAAATNRNGTIGFVSCHGRHRGLSHVQPDSASAADSTVEAVKIDDLIKESGMFIAAKIDVEGYERGVLEGMENAIRSNACVLQIEINNDVLSIMDIVRDYGLSPAGQIGNDYYFVK
jgi:FkbM family methyltransferase